MDARSSLIETKSSRKQSSFLAEMPLIKLIGTANWQSPVIALNFLPLCHRNTRLRCILTKQTTLTRIFLLYYELF